MFALFAHHTEAVVEIELFGRKFPDGMAEHALVFAAAVVLAGLAAYGTVALIRDLRRLRQPRPVVA